MNQEQMWCQLHVQSTELETKAFGCHSIEGCNEVAAENAQHYVRKVSITHFIDWLVGHGGLAKCHDGGSR